MNQSRLVLNARPIDLGEPASLPGLVLVERAGPLVTIPPVPIVITVTTEAPGNGLLSHWLQIGCTYHQLCRNAFVEHVQIGYYAYERREEWRTCALAATYAGAFGPKSVEKPEFSYTMAIWRLSQRLGFDIGKFQVVGPTGRQNNLADEMIKLVDENLWTRTGVAEWLASIGV